MTMYPGLILEEFVPSVDVTLPANVADPSAEILEVVAPLFAVDLPVNTSPEERLVTMAPSESSLAPVPEPAP